MSDLETFEPLALRIPEAGRAIGLGHSKLFELIASGDLDARKIGSRTVITMESIRAFLESRPKADVRLPSRRPAA